MEEQEEGEVPKKKLVEKVQRKDGESLYGREERRKERKGGPRERQTSQSETSLGGVWKMAVSPFAFGTELVVCQCYSGRIAENDGEDGKTAAAGSSSERKQVVGGDPAKVEAAKRRKTELK